MTKNFSDKQIHILEVAEKLIAEKGFEGTSVREISSEAGINVAMISYYFGSKEKMMSYLYRYRVQKTREHFAEFAELVREGRPEMQLKELVKYVISQLFKYHYFHGFVTQEFRHKSEFLKEELLGFYNVFTQKTGEVIRKGVSVGVFMNAPSAEDLLVTIIGSSLFVIRNKNFYEQYVNGNQKNYLIEAEKKVTASILITVFSVVGFQPAP